MLPVSWQMGWDLVFDDLEGGRGNRPFFLIFQRLDEGLVDILGDFRRGAPDQFQEGRG
jgi:hypothetical protein